MPAPGFRRLPVDPTNLFLNHTIPLWGRYEGAQLWLGFEVQDVHTNPVGNCHGGLMATFADTLLGLTLNLQAETLDGAFAPTVSLNLDFLSMAKLGAWVSGRAEILKSGRTLLFMDGVVMADDRIAMRVSGIFAAVGGAGRRLDLSEMKAALR